MLLADRTTAVLKKLITPTLLCFIAACCFATQEAIAQQETLSYQNADELGEVLPTMNREYGIRYTEPLSEGIPAGLGANLFWRGRVSSDYYAGIDDINLSFSYQYTSVPIEPDEMSFAYQEVEGGVPTVFGSRRPANLREGVLPPGVFPNQGSFPVAVFQAGVGIPHWGIRVSGRFVPEMSRPGFGTPSLYGAGLLWSLNSIAPGLPFGMGFYGYAQQGSIENSSTGEEIASTQIYSAGGVIEGRLFGSRIVGANLSILAGMEKGQTVFSYEQIGNVLPVPAGQRPASEDDPVSVRFEYKEPILFRGRVGGEFYLGPFALRAGYAIFPRQAFVFSGALTI